MLSRRQFLTYSTHAALSLTLSGCSGSPPLRKDVFADFGDPARPYLGLATSLHQEYNYPARVAGRIPRDLRGTLYRNGPGLFDRGGLRKRNILDGDGMIQAFHFHAGGVQYRNRFVRTEKYMAEEQAGQFLFPSWSTQAPGGRWANLVGLGDLKGQAGITVFPWQGRLYAFDECSLPYELLPTTLETVGRSTLGLPEEQTIYAAHAKLDPVTGEWLHFGVRYGPDPQLHITIFRPDGRLGQHRVLPMPANVYMHDWFVSERYLVLNFHPVEIDFWDVLLGNSSLAESLRWRPQKGNNIMVLERDGSGEPLMLEGDACYMWHSLNAWQRGDSLMADFIGYRNPDHFVGADPVVTAVMTGQGGKHLFPGELRRYRIEPRRGTLREELLDRGSYEWPRINEMHRCRPYRFGYVVKTRPDDFFWTIVCRVDMATGRTEQYDFGPRSYCTEPVFVPLPRHRYHAGHAQEPGYLLVEVYDSTTRRSFLAILRAERLGDGPLAVVHLRHHVPFSYHGWWLAQR